MPAHTLDTARRSSDLLLTGLQIPAGEATELPPAEGLLQWRLAVALQADDAGRAFAATQPMEWLS